MKSSPGYNTQSRVAIIVDSLASLEENTEKLKADNEASPQHKSLFTVLNAKKRDEIIENEKNNISAIE